MLVSSIKILFTITVLNQEYFFLSSLCTPATALIDRMCLLGLLVIRALLVDLIVTINKVLIVDEFGRILLMAMVCNAVTIDKGGVNLNWTTTHLNCHLVAIVIVMIAVISLGCILL